MVRNIDQETINKVKRGIELVKFFVLQRSIQALQWCKSDT